MGLSSRSCGVDPVFPTLKRGEEIIDVTGGSSSSMVSDRRNDRSKVVRIEQIFQEANSRYFDGRIPRPEFKLNRRMKKAGSVDLHRWQMDISISYHDRYGWDEELRNTVKHEMIHLYLRMIGRPTGHSPYYKEIMEEIGCTLHSKPNRRPFKYVFECPHCRKEYKTRKWIGKRYSCGTCSHGVFNRKYLLEFKRELR